MIELRTRPACIKELTQVKSSNENQGQHASKSLPEVNGVMLEEALGYE